MKKIVWILFLAFLTKSSFAQTPELLLQKGHSKKINVIEFSPKTNFFATGGEDNAIILTDAVSGTAFKTLLGHTQPVLKLFFTADGKRLISSSERETICWNLETEKKIYEINFGVDNALAPASVSADGKYYYFKNNEANEMILDIAAGKIIETDLDFTSDLRQISFTPDGKFLLLITEENVRVVDQTTKAEKFILGTQQLPKCFFITRDGKYYYCANNYLNWQKWDLNTGKLAETRKGRIDNSNQLDEHAIVLVNGEHTIMSVYEKQSLSFYDLWSGKKISNTNYKKNKYEEDDSKTTLTCASLDFSGNLFIAAMSSSNDSRSTIQRIWYIDTKSGRTIRETKGYTSYVQTISLAPDDRHLAIAGNEDDRQAVRIWEMDKAGGRFFSLDKSTIDTKNISWSPDSRVIIAGQTMTDLGTHEYKSFTDHFSFVQDQSNALPYVSPDFKLNVGHKRILNYETGQPVCMINVEQDVCSKNFNDTEEGDIKGEIKFSPDNKTLLLLKPDYKTIYVNIYDMLECKKSGIISWSTQAPVTNDDKVFSSVSSSGKYVILGTNAVAVYSLNSQDKVLEIPGIQDQKKCMVNSVAMNAAENIIAVSYRDTSIVLYDFPSGKMLHKLSGHDLPSTSLAFKNSGNILLSASPDARIIFWDAGTGEQMGTLATIDSTDFIITTPDNYYFATKNALKYVAFRSGKKVYPFEQFDLRYNRPDKVFKKLALASDKQTKMYNLAYTKRLKKAGLTEELLSKDFDGPVVEIKNKYALPLIKYDDTLSFNFSANDPLNGISKINVYVNDVAIYGSNGFSLANNPKQISKKINLNLSSGINTIQVTAINVKGVESKRESFTINCETTKKPDLYMLVVGVSEYKESENNLKYAAKDAQDLVNAFEKDETFATKHIKVLLNNAATKENVIKESVILTQSKEDDVVIIYVSGHGILDEKLDYYLAMHDISFVSPAEKGLPYEELEKIIDKVVSRNRLILIDACHSGEVDKDEVLLAENKTIDVQMDAKIVSRGSTKTPTPRAGLNNSFAYMQALFDDVSKGIGATIISAAGGMEYALESPDWNNGVFTYSILEGLKSKNADLDQDGEITIGELKEYVTDKVVKLTEGRQVPNARKENLNNNFIIQK